MAKVTIRIKDSIYNNIKDIAKEEHITATEIVNSILEKGITNIELNTRLDNMLYLLNSISKLQVKHYSLSKQDFVNKGYAMNMDINKDKCLKDFEDYSRKNKYNE